MKHQKIKDQIIFNIKNWSGGIGYFSDDVIAKHVEVDSYKQLLKNVDVCKF